MGPDGPKTYKIERGVLKRSVLDLLLWKIMYDAVVTLPMPRVTKTIDFANDVGLVVVAKYLEKVKQMAHKAVAIFRRWNKIGRPHNRGPSGDK